MMPACSLYARACGRTWLTSGVDNDGRLRLMRQSLQPDIADEWRVNRLLARSSYAPLIEVDRKRRFR